ncbi:MAG TPA: HAD-IIB family hydrolase [Methylomirabilota bacterium]|nr:HAD-IIB family hydrolase [Methylomirabilota bacterium]
MHYKALMLDLDGTTVLNYPDALPSPAVVKAIKKAQKKLFVCIATGRPLGKAQTILDVLHITNPVILLGGSQIIDGASRKLIYEKSLENKDLTPILSILTAYDIPIVIDYKQGHSRYSPLQKFTEKVFNILAINLSEEVADEIINKLTHISTATAHKILSWDQGYIVLNISHVLATKQHAIFEVAKRLRIEPNEIIGVGDGYNDFPLLMACGLKVAMGNAVADLKAIADYIAPPVEQDGVVAVIEKFVLQ